MMRWSLLAVPLLLSLACTAGADEAPPSGWSIKPHPERHACSAIRETLDPVSFGFEAVDEDVALVLIGIGWEVHDGTYPAQIDLGDGPGVTAPAEGNGKAYAIVLTPDLEQRLGTARKLQVSVDGRSFSGPIDHLKRTIDAVRRCTAAPHN